MSVCLPGNECPSNICNDLRDNGPEGRARRAVLSRRVSRSNSDSTGELVSKQKVTVDSSDCALIEIEGNIATCRQQKSAGSGTVACSASFITSVIAWWLH